jgi:Fe-S-cluster containining protein
MDYTAFVKTWCRWVPLGRDSERLSLKEKSNFDCIFWDNGCTVYNVRPLQCRAYPFWDSVVCSEKAWNETGKDCPGINSGTLHDKEKIENFIRLLEEEPVIERKIPRLGV